jgi:hypothetical protein
MGKLNEKQMGKLPNGEANQGNTFEESCPTGHLQRSSHSTIAVRDEMERLGGWVGVWGGGGGGDQGGVHANFKLGHLCGGGVPLAVPLSGGGFGGRGGVGGWRGGGGGGKT